MEVSLRKADQLANAIKELLQDNSVVQTISLNAFDDNWKTKIEAQRAAVADKVLRLTKLYRALAEVRKAVGRANAECGINDLLATDNFHKQIFSMLHAISVAEPASDDAVIGSNLAARQTKGEHDRFGYGNNYDMQVNLLDSAYLEKVKQTCLKSRSSVVRLLTS